jgi:hypothetical protein
MGFNTTLFTSILIVTIVVVSFMLFALSLSTSHDFEVAEEYQNVFNQYAEVEKELDTQQQIIEGGEVNSEGSDQAVYKNVVVAGKQSMAASKTAGLLARDLFKTLRIDISIYGIVLMLIVFSSIGGFIYLITGRKP